MTDHSPSLEVLATQVCHSLGASELTPAVARLYSQHTRLRQHQEGLPTWSPNEASSRLTDAYRLLDAALILRSSGAANWQHPMRRAAEILEWLSHPSLNPEGTPLHLLAAAAYQLSGYPARSASLLDDLTPRDSRSSIVMSFLRADFQALIGHLSQFWAYRLQASEANQTPCDRDPSEVFIVEEIVRSLGVVCAAIRWGNDPRIDTALRQLKTASHAFVHTSDSYSWTLAKLCAEVARTYVESSLRSCTNGIKPQLPYLGQIALENYIRYSFLTNRTLAWPSQRAGITRLKDGSDFTLCTPTGSGKTTVAEIAILMGLFPQREQDEDENYTFEDDALDEEAQSEAPLVLYLVPSRALAAEVERKLARVLRNIGDQISVTVTGLYGGIDWGPTDAWLTSSQPTVLICTYEKAEALVRFLGPLFIERVTLIVIDEAHSVNFPQSGSEAPSYESRPLRLEAIGTRLLCSVPPTARVIALSAVAAGFDQSLA